MKVRASSFWGSQFSLSSKSWDCHGQMVSWAIAELPIFWEVGPTESEHELRRESMLVSINWLKNVSGLDSRLKVAYTIVFGHHKIYKVKWCLLLYLWRSSSASSNRKTCQKEIPHAAFSNLWPSQTLVLLLTPFWEGYG